MTCMNAWLDAVSSSLHLLNTQDLKKAMQFIDLFRSASCLLAAENQPLTDHDNGECTRAILDNDLSSS